MLVEPMRCAGGRLRGGAYRFDPRTCLDNASEGSLMSNQSALHSSCWGAALDRVRAGAPLVHCITNYVTVNDCANALLACGASPIMSDEPADVEDITSICQALVLNIGTLNQASIEAMRIAGERAVLTIKGTTQNAARPEFEVALDIDMAQSMLNTLCQSPIIEKTRYIYPYAGHTWEVDCFHGDNQGLVMAEIELTHPDETYDLPPFIGRQVTHLPRYYNACLATHPYSQWSDTEKEE